jgi:type I restriction enzyme M protein
LPSHGCDVLQKLPEGDDLGKAINAAMRAIEAENEELKDILPRSTSVSTTLR